MSKKSGRSIIAAMAATIIFITTHSSRVSAQANLETFGQNRVQYRKFDWKFFETAHFRIYHYDAAGRQLARYVSEQVENDIKVVEEKIGGQFPRSFKIIVYNSYDDYRQTNIGRKDDSQLQDVPAGTVKLVGDKLVVYFTGEHTDLRRQTREGMSRVVMERMLFGDSFREMVKNAVLLNLPAWTVNGYLAYIVDGWDTESNSEWKNLMEANPTWGFHQLAEKNPELAGKAFWKYVSDKYGDNNMKNLLYNMQLKASLSQGIKMTLDQKVKAAYDSAVAFYKDVYAQEALTKETPDSTALITIDVPKDNTVIRDIKVAPKGNDIAYVAWKDGEYKIYQQKTRNEQERTVLLSGGRLDYNEVPDPNYPMIAWSNNGLKLAILFKKNNQVRLKIFNSLKAKIEDYRIPSNRFDRILGMTFMEDDTKMVFSAIKRSQTDLYEFTIKGSKMVNITNDAWDDVQPWFVSGGSRKGVLFLSNRPEPNLNVPIDVNELPTGPMNMFFYNTKTRRRELLQMTDIKSGTITQPIQYGSDNYAYLYDGNGIVNTYVVLMGRNAHNQDSAYNLPITNYTQNIISHQYNPASNQVATVIQDGDKYNIYFKELQMPGVNVAPKDLKPTILGSTELNKRFSPVATYATSGDGQVYHAPEPVNEPILKSGTVFQSEFPDNPTDETNKPDADTTSITPVPQLATDTATALQEEANDSTLIKTDSTYVKMKPQPYRLSFKLNNFTVRVDNNLLFNKYQSVSQNGGAYSNPSLAGLLTASLDDLMENHRFTGGVRLPINFSGLTYFLQYENFKRRTDWGILFLRTEDYFESPLVLVDSSGTPVANTTILNKVNTTIIQGSASYPLDRVRAIKMFMNVRQDKRIIKSRDVFGLIAEAPDSKQYWVSGRVEYVFDNTRNPLLNIYNGMRYKFFAEYLYRVNNPNGGFYNLGLDFRYYHKLYRNFIWANRLAGAHSGGNQKILYYLGGVDSWLSPKYSSFVPVRPTENYAFQALATNLRGYYQNARNGNTYAVFNSELRLPILNTFLKRPIQSSVLRNLQAIAFVDAGSAWNGLFPNADALRNNSYLYNPSNGVALTIFDQTGGLGLGYGAGLRTTLFGYFVRADVAWSLENYRKPVIYISLGTDF